MSLKTTLRLLLAASTLAGGCIDRKHVEDASVGAEAGAEPDTAAYVPMDGQANGVEAQGDTTSGRPDTGAVTEVSVDLPVAADVRFDLVPDLPQGSEVIPDAPGESVPLPLDLRPDDLAVSDILSDLGPDVSIVPDLGTELPRGPEVGPELPPAGCTIGGISYTNGAPNPTNSCQVCKVAISPSDWSNADEGMPCGTGPTCSGTTKSYGHWTCQNGSCTQPAATICPSTGCNTTTGLCNDACGTGNTAGPVQCGTTCCASDQFCISNTNCGPKTGPGSARPYGNAQCTTNYCVGGYCCSSSSCGRGETCASGICTCAMNAAKVCNSCADWDFEWGTNPAPWVAELDPNWGTANGTTGTSINSSLYHIGTGSNSLMAQVDVDLSATVQAEVAVALSCATSLAGYGLSAWVYLAGPALTNWNDSLMAETWNGTTQGDYQPFLLGGVPTGQWFQATTTFSPGTTTPVNRIGIRLVPSIPWNGQMYIDDVVLTAPSP